jgi:hypothetical protein
MKRATKNPQDTTQAVSVLKLSEAARRKIAKDLGIEAGVQAVPEAIHILRVSRRNLPTRVALPQTWILVEA